MFRSAATVSATVGPVAPDWTIHELVAWIAADDTRSHDEALRPLLTTVLADVAPDASPALTPRSTVALVRGITSRLRAAPALREIALRDVAGGVISAATTPVTTASADRGTATPASASVRRPSLQVT
jgi:hypothetical protein